MCLIKVDLLHIGIGFADSLIERGRSRSHAEDTAAVRDEPAVLDSGACVEHERIGHIVQTGDLLALLVSLRIAAGRHADAARCVV